MTAGPRRPAPTMTPTRASTLVAAFAVAAALAWVLVSRYYGAIPALPWLPLVTFVLLAVAEAVTARATRNRLRRRPGTEPVDPLVVARLAALAKASSLGGALFGGLYAGVFLFVFVERSRLAAAADDAPVAGGGIVVCAALVAAALWLERACRIPDKPEDGPDARV
jgi:hypothetical protein